LRNKVDGSQGLGRCGHDLAQNKWCGVWEDLVKVEGPKEKTSLVMFLRSFGAQEQVEGKVNVVK